MCAKPTLDTREVWYLPAVKKNGSSVSWESGWNRVINIGSACTLTLNDELAPIVGDLTDRSDL